MPIFNQLFHKAARHRSHPRHHTFAGAIGVESPSGKIQRHDAGMRHLPVVRIGRLPKRLAGGEGEGEESRSCRRARGMTLSPSTSGHWPACHSGTWRRIRDEAHGPLEFAARCVEAERIARSRDDELSVTTGMVRVIP